MRSTDSPEHRRTQSYLRQLPTTFSPEQRSIVQQLLEQALTPPPPKPKLVDLRFVIDLVLVRYFFVLMIGQDQRAKVRQRSTHGLSRLGNAIAAILLLLSLNLMISSVVFLSLYLLKSVLGIDLLPGHLGQTH